MSSFFYLLNQGGLLCWGSRSEEIYFETEWRYGRKNNLTSAIIIPARWQPRIILVQWQPNLDALKIFRLASMLEHAGLHIGSLGHDISLLRWDRWSRIFLPGRCKLTSGARVGWGWCCRIRRVRGWRVGGGLAGCWGWGQSLHLLSPSSCNWCLHDMYAGASQVFTVSTSSAPEDISIIQMPPSALHLTEVCHDSITQIGFSTC